MIRRWRIRRWRIRRNYRALLTIMQRERTTALDVMEWIERNVH